MMVYAVILILVMLATNNATFKTMLGRLKPRFRKAEPGKEAA